jgi:Family of unknown function (DUF6152)
MRIRITQTGIRKAIERTVLTAVLAAFGGGLAMAHHSFAAFNMGATKVITGTVSKVNWTNPHTWIWVDVPNDKGGVDTWGVEGMSPNYLARRGWSRNTIKEGDKISVTIHPMKDGENGGTFMSAKLANGQVLSMTGGAITDP